MHVKMKYLLEIIFLFSFTAVLSQNSNDQEYRAKSGDLTYEECMSLIESERFTEAIPSLKNRKQFYENPEQYDGLYYYKTMMALYCCYYKIGDIVSARDAINEAGILCSKRESSENNVYTRNLLCCRGQLENALSNYDEALRYFHLANNFFEAANEYDDAYMVLLNNMGIAYLGKGDFLSSKLYMDEMKDVFEHLYGSFTDNIDDDQYPFLAYYALMLQSIGHEAEAEKYYLNVINNCERDIISSDAYLLSANNLSIMYSKKGRWEDCVKILENFQGLNSFSNYALWQNLAIGYIHTNRHQKAISALRKMNDCFISNIEHFFSNFTGKERENIWDVMANATTNVNNLIAYRTNNSQAISMAYNNTLLCKSLSAKAYRLMGEFVAASGDHDLKKLYQRYLADKNAYSFKSNDFETKDSLRREINSSERKILGYAGKLGLWLKQDSKTWEDVKNSLKQDEVAIEYCHLPDTNSYPIKEFRYGAFILRSDYDSPIFVALDDIKIVNDLFYYNNADALYINEIYASNKKNDLFYLLWHPLMAYLKDVKTIYYSLTGLLSELNFDVLCGEDGKMLNEKYHMIRVSSTANIGDLKVDNSNIQASVLYGNVKYDETTTDMASASSSYSTYSGTDIYSELALRSENERGKWGSIPSTKKEIDEISALLTNKGISVSVFEGNAANEESFKLLSGKSPEIIHLATHGFVINTQQRAEGNMFVSSTYIYSQKDSYMMWAGLMLAGGNNVWQGKFDQPNVEDGILTADEISRMDLSNTKLVVLSACETARGKIDYIDGVYGLQRAFKMAGVGTIVMSLWKVQDDATSMLMTLFYTYLTGGVEKHQALWKAMMDVRAKYKDPYYWAGFVMLD